MSGASCASFSTKLANLKNCHNFESQAPKEPWPKRNSSGDVGGWLRRIVSPRGWSMFNRNTQNLQPSTMYENPQGERALPDPIDAFMMEDLSLRLQTQCAYNAKLE